MDVRHLFGGGGGGGNERVVPYIEKFKKAASERIYHRCRWTTSHGMADLDANSFFFFSARQ